jgi:hypothetical protein
MNVSRLLSNAKQLGVEIQVHNGKLFANGKPEAINSILPLMKTHKAELLNHFNITNPLPAHTAPKNNNGPNNLDTGSLYTDQDLFYDFTERAGILQYEGGMGIVNAERLAYHETLIAHMRRDHSIILDGHNILMIQRPQTKDHHILKT